MGRYIIRRLLQFIPTVLGAMFLLNYMTSIGIQLTGNPVRALFGDRTPTQSQLVAAAAKYHLDDSCLTQKFNPCLGTFWDRLQSIFLHWDFGITLTSRRPVWDVMVERFPNTTRLAVLAIVIEIVIGIVAGVIAGLRHDSFWDNLVKVTTVFAISVPVFVLGAAVRTFVGGVLGKWMRGESWIPELVSSGIFNGQYKAGYPWASLIIPAFVLATLSLATTARLTRTSLMENMRADYVRTAKAKGLRTRRVVGVHTLRNSLIPVITFLGVDFATLLSGAVVTERIFNVPGVGSLIARSAVTGDPATVLGVTTFLVMIFLVVNLLVDILYAVLDPRIRYE